VDLLSEAKSCNRVTLNACVCFFFVVDAAKKKRDETGRLVADDVLRGLFNVASFHLEELPKLIRPMLNSVPPLEFDHLIRVSGAPQDNVQCWDVAVQDPFVPPPNPSRLAQEILQNDRQVAAAMSEIRLHVFWFPLVLLFDGSSFLC
jgi:hypothetical protein